MEAKAKGAPKKKAKAKAKAGASAPEQLKDEAGEQQTLEDEDDADLWDQWTRAWEMSFGMLWYLQMVPQKHG